MQFSWQNLKAAIAEMVTSKQLSVESGKLITDAVEADVSGTSASAVPATPPVAATTPVATTTPTDAPAAAAPAASAPVVPVPVAPAAPVAATTTVPVADADVQKQLADAQAEIRRLKAAQTPGLAAAAAAGDITQQSGKTSASGDENPHFANLKRIKAKYKAFGLTDEINVGSSED